MKLGFVNIVHVEYEYYAEYYYNLFGFQSCFYVFIAYTM